MINAKSRVAIAAAIRAGVSVSRDGINRRATHYGVMSSGGAVGSVRFSYSNSGGGVGS